MSEQVSCNCKCCQHWQSLKPTEAVYNKADVEVLLEALELYAKANIDHEEAREAIIAVKSGVKEIRHPRSYGHFARQALKTWERGE